MIAVAGIVDCSLGVLVALDIVGIRVIVAVFIRVATAWVRVEGNCRISKIITTSRISARHPTAPFIRRDFRPLRFAIMSPKFLKNLHTFNIDAL